MNYRTSFFILCSPRGPVFYYLNDFTLYIIYIIIFIYMNQTGAIFSNNLTSSASFLYICCVLSIKIESIFFFVISDLEWPLVTFRLLISKTWLWEGLIDIELVFFLFKSKFIFFGIFDLDWPLVTFGLLISKTG